MTKTLNTIDYDTLSYTHYALHSHVKTDINLHQNAVNTSKLIDTGAWLFPTCLMSFPRNKCNNKLINTHRLQFSSFSSVHTGSICLGSNLLNRPPSVRRRGKGTNAASTLGQRLRRWPNIEAAFVMLVSIPRRWLWWVPANKVISVHILVRWGKLPENV